MELAHFIDMVTAISVHLFWRSSCTHDTNPFEETCFGAIQPVHSDDLSNLEDATTPEDNLPLYLLYNLKPDTHIQLLTLRYMLVENLPL